MKTFKMILAANESRPANVNGEFFFLRYVQYPLPEVKLLDRNGGTVSILEDAVTTDWDRTGPFERVEITNGPNPQTIYFRYGNGDTGSNVFSGNVNGSIIALDAATIAALIAGKYTVRPEAHTGTHNSAGTLAAATPTPLFLPGANTNGAILLQAAASDVGSSPSLTAFLAKNGAPANLADGVDMLTCPIIGGYSTVAVVGGRLETPQFIPAGLGLYIIISADAGGNHKRSARWLLL